LEFVDAGLLDVESDDRDAFAKFDGQRQANITETDNADAGIRSNQGEPRLTPTNRQ